MILKIINGADVETFEDVYSADLPGKDGRITIMIKHLPIVVALKAGIMHIDFSNKTEKDIEIPTGICLFQNEVMEIICSEYEV
ncbi:MAG: hypothetical protein PF692_04360 [Kiritimatiellae bacterium]|jgi:F0F1-type ATP synthase epsilon subunit|nr:hypothetical protein [Kiritimatiellia bacterium]